MHNHTMPESNSLWFSELLPILYPEFFTRFRYTLKKYGIVYNLLRNTKDVWAVDYMPVQIGTIEFVQFVYDPDYLKPKKYRHLKSNPDDVCAGLSIIRNKSNLVVDGGNVIRSSGKVVMCDKVFKENSGVNPNDLIAELEEYFKTDKIIFIPWDRNDFTGHADGMVRFIDNDTVLINERINENSVFEKRLRASLKGAGLDIMELPYAPPNDPTFTSAKGLHLNYLQMKQAVVVPLFNQETDDKAVRLFENIFKGQNIATIDCNEIAAEGGVLNCISWSVASD
jgi:agmatine deiminase